MVIGISGIILGISTLSSHIYNVVSYYRGTYILGHPLCSFLLREVIGIVFSSIAIIASIYILKLANWARKLLILIMIADFSTNLLSISIIINILPFSKYGFLRKISGYIVEFSSSLHFDYLNKFILYFEHIPDRVFEYFSWVNFSLSIIVPMILIYYLTRVKIKKEFK